MNPTLSNTLVDSMPPILRNAFLHIEQSAETIEQRVAVTVNEPFRVTDTRHLLRVPSVGWTEEGERAHASSGGVVITDHA